MRARQPLARAAAAQPLRSRVFIHDLAARAPSAAEWIASSLALTPAEARVAARLAAGHTPQQVADAHGVSITTVRSQIRQILQKAGVSRQSDLIALLARLPQVP